MPASAGQTALAPLDFHGLGAEDTRDLRDGLSVLGPTCSARWAAPPLKRQVRAGPIGSGRPIRARGSVRSDA